MKLEALYDAIKQTKQAIDRMEVDIENSVNENSRSVAAKGREALLESYLSLYNADVLLPENFTTIKTKVASCMKNLNMR